MTGEFGAALRDFLGAYAKPVVPPDDTELVWTRLCGELGLAGLLVPERHGGLGCGVAELIDVSTELGRAVVGGPFVPSAVVAATALSIVDPSHQLLAGIATGEATPTLVHVPFAATSVAPVLAASVCRASPSSRCCCCSVPYRHRAAPSRRRPVRRPSRRRKNWRISRWICCVAARTRQPTPTVCPGRT